jgi:hypothetical protein
MKHSLKPVFVHSCYLGYGIITIAFGIIIKWPPSNLLASTLIISSAPSSSAFSSKDDLPLSSLSGDDVIVFFVFHLCWIYFSIFYRLYFSLQNMFFCFNSVTILIYYCFFTIVSRWSLEKMNKSHYWNCDHYNRNIKILYHNLALYQFDNLLFTWQYSFNLS